MFLAAFFDRRARKRREILGLMVHHPSLAFEKLARIHSPCLVITGEKDMIKPSHSRAIAAAIPGAEEIVLPGADHFCAARRSGDFTRRFGLFEAASSIARLAPARAPVIQ